MGPLAVILALSMEICREVVVGSTSVENLIFLDYQESCSLYLNVRKTFSDQYVTQTYSAN